MSQGYHIRYARIAIRGYVFTNKYEYTFGVFRIRSGYFFEVVGAAQKSKVSGSE